jgi:Fe-S oxidoreductase
VVHHTEFIQELLKMKRLKINQKTREKIVFHDSCYLGRYNDIYKEPRQILKSCSGGKSPLEMPRNREKSFCCGAGGGLVWMEEMIGKRIYLERTQEALKKNPETIAVACPYCKTMFDDGINDERVADKVKVRDIAEIVADAL